LFCRAFGVSAGGAAARTGGARVGGAPPPAGAPAASPAEPGASCEVCGKMIGLLTCGRCKTARYCSSQHQRKDWARHKAHCVAPKKKQAEEPANDAPAG
jgi:hypothetical protein